MSERAFCEFAAKPAELLASLALRAPACRVDGTLLFRILINPVSRAAAELDEQLDAWRNRPIGEITYLILDARYEKVRHDGAIRSCALLTAIGIGTDGKRSVPT